jgi:hypothetical protein
VFQFTLAGLPPLPDWYDTYIVFEALDGNGLRSNRWPFLTATGAPGMVDPSLGDVAAQDGQLPDQTPIITSVSVDPTFCLGAEHVDESKQLNVAVGTDGVVGVEVCHVEIRHLYDEVLPIAVTATQTSPGHHTAAIQVPAGWLASGRYIGRRQGTRSK